MRNPIQPCCVFFDVIHLCNLAGAVAELIFPRNSGSSRLMKPLDLTLKSIIPEFQKSKTVFNSYRPFTVYSGLPINSGIVKNLLGGSQTAGIFA